MFFCHSKWKGILFSVTTSRKWEKVASSKHFPTANAVENTPDKHSGLANELEQQEEIKTTDFLSNEEPEITEFFKNKYSIRPPTRLFNDRHPYVRELVQNFNKTVSLK